MFAVDADDISKICVNHPLHTYPVILAGMVSGSQFSTIVCTIMGSALPTIQPVFVFSGAGDDYRGLSGRGLIDLICQLMPL